MLGLHRESAQDLRAVVALAFAGPRQNIRVGNQLHGDAAAAGLLDFLRRNLGHAEIAHGGGHNRDIRRREGVGHRIEHILRGHDAHHIHRIGRGQGDWTGDQRYVGTKFGCGRGNRIPHLAGGMVRQIADRV